VERPEIVGDLLGWASKEIADAAAAPVTSVGSTMMPADRRMPAA
jgi:DNA-directed RNA polymerase specialized sigma24 family protein